MNVSVIIDADSMIYASAMSESLSEAKEKLDNKLNLALNEIEDLGYIIDEFIVCSGSYGNFRKFISSSYKSNRVSEKPLHLTELQKYCRVNWMSKYVLGVETDDVVASYWNKIYCEGKIIPIIVSIDKDYLQFPATIYNYERKTLVTINEVDAHRNFYTQMLVGDVADNVKGVKGCGVKCAEKTLSNLGSRYSMSRAVYELYIKAYKGKANIKYRETYSLLKLRVDCL
jgi:5'-3' exonuclease